MYSYFIGRTQCVKIKNYLSSQARVSYSVPQGGILGPLLFILFVNDLSLHSSLELDLYANGSTSHSSSKTMNELDDKLSTSMEDIQQWYSGKGMVINRTKTKTMVVTQ